MRSGYIGLRSSSRWFICLAKWPKWVKSFQQKSKAAKSLHLSFCSPILDTKKSKSTCPPPPPHLLLPLVLWRALKGCQDSKSEEFYTVKCERARRGKQNLTLPTAHTFETNCPRFWNSHSFSLFFAQTIGIDSEFCIVESLVTGIVDMWPDLLRPRRRQFTTGICILLFLLGVPMVTNGGAYVFQVRIPIYVNDTIKRDSGNQINFREWRGCVDCFLTTLRYVIFAVDGFL